MNEIRVNRGIVVNVNDDGDTIVINTEDQRFMDNFLLLTEKLDKISKEANAPELESKSEREQLQYLMEKTKIIMADIDGLFGKDACKKVFGDIIPSPYLIADFFDQMIPIAEKYMDERQRKISQKYSNRRKGSKNKYRNKEQIIQDMMNGKRRN